MCTGISIVNSTQTYPNLISIAHKETGKATELPFDQQNRFLQMLDGLKPLLKKIKDLFENNKVAVVFASESANHMLGYTPFPKYVHVRFLFRISENKWEEIQKRVLSFFPHKKVIYGFTPKTDYHRLTIDSSLVIDFAGIDSNDKIIHPYPSTVSLDCRCYDFTSSLEETSKGTGFYFATEGYDFERSLSLSAQDLFEVKPGGAEATPEGLEYYCAWITVGKRPVAYQTNEVEFSSYERDYCKEFCLRYKDPSAREKMYDNIKQLLLIFYSEDSHAQLLYLINFLEILRRVTLQDSCWKDVKQEAETAVVRLLVEKFNFSEEEEILYTKSYFALQNPSVSHQYKENTGVSRISIKVEAKEEEEEQKSLSLAQKPKDCRTFQLVVQGSFKLDLLNQSPFIQKLKGNFPSKYAQIEMSFSTPEAFNRDFESILRNVGSAPEAYGQNLLKLLNVPSSMEQRMMIRNQIDRLIPKLVHCSVYTEILIKLSEQPEWFTVKKAPFLFSSPLETLVKQGEIMSALYIFKNLLQIKDISLDLLGSIAGHFLGSNVSAENLQSLFEILKEASLKNVSVLIRLKRKIDQVFKKMDADLISSCAWPGLLALCKHYERLPESHDVLNDLILCLVTKTLVFPVKALRAINFLREDIRQRVFPKKEKKPIEQKEEVQKEVKKPVVKQEDQQRLENLKKTIIQSIQQNKDLKLTSFFNKAILLPRTLQIELHDFLQGTVFALSAASKQIALIMTLSIDFSKFLVRESSDEEKYSLLGKLYLFLSTTFLEKISPENDGLINLLVVAWEFIVPYMTEGESEVAYLNELFVKINEKIRTGQFQRKEFTLLLKMWDFFLVKMHEREVSRDSLIKTFDTTKTILRQFATTSPALEAIRCKAFELGIKTVKEDVDDETKKSILALIPSELDRQDPVYSPLFDQLKHAVPSFSKELDANVEKAKKAKEAKFKRIQELRQNLKHDSQKKNWDGVIAHYKELIVLQPVAEPDVLLNVSHAYFMRTKSEEGFQVLHLGTKKYPNHREIHLRLSNHQIKAARLWLEKRPNLCPETFSYGLQQKNAEMIVLNSVHRLTNLREKGAQEDLEINYCLAKAYFCFYSLDKKSNKALPIAREFIEKYIQEKPSDSEGFGLLGSIALIERDFQTAITRFRTAISLNSSDVEYYTQIIEAHLGKDEEVLALSYLTDAFKAWPDQPHLLYLYGQYFFKLGDKKAAMQKFLEAREKSNHCLEFYYLIINYCFQKKYYQEFLEIIEEGLKKLESIHHHFLIGFRLYYHQILLQETSEESSKAGEYKKKIKEDSALFQRLKQANAEKDAKDKAPAGKMNMDDEK